MSVYIDKDLQLLSVITAGIDAVIIDLPPWILESVQEEPQASALDLQAVIQEGSIENPIRLDLDSPVEENPPAPVPAMVSTPAPAVEVAVPVADPVPAVQVAVPVADSSETPSAVPVANPERSRKRKYVCSKCKQDGHNARRCK